MSEHNFLHVFKLIYFFLKCVIYATSAASTRFEKISETIFVR